MTDMNLLALFFYVAAVWWGVAACAALVRIDLMAAIAMGIVCLTAIEAGNKRWGTEPKTVVVGPIMPPESR